MKLLHTSDWHLGRQFHNVSLLKDQAYVLDQLIDIAVNEAVDVLLIAGDIYDRTVPPAAAVNLLDDVLDRLCRVHNITVIMIPGNHDSAERLGFGARQLIGAGLHIIASLEQILTPVVLNDPHGEIAFYGIPYLEPARVREAFEVKLSGHDETLAFVLDKIRTHNQQQSDRRCVILSHCFLDGGTESDSERPLSVGGADRVSIQHFQGFDYVALGHLHGAQFKGSEHIRYSGSILKYSFSEEHQCKSLTRVKMDARGVCQIKKIPLKPLHDMRSIEGRLKEVLENALRDPSPEDYVQVKLSDTQAILDIMGQLRAAYPNVLHLERPGLEPFSDQHQVHKERIKEGEMSMFGDFFEQVTTKTMSAEQTRALEQVIEQARHGVIDQ